MYVDTACSARIPFRKVVPEWEVKKEMRKWIKISNCYLSVYKFERIDENGRPVKESAVIDKIYLDIDVMDSDGNTRDVNLEPLVDWCRENDLVRWHAFTGGGFSSFIKIEGGSTKNLARVHSFVRGIIGVDADRACIDVMRCCRMVPSYNFNKKAYASYIKEEELLEDFFTVRNRYKKPFNVRKKKIVYGTKAWDVSSISGCESRSIDLPPLVRHEGDSISRIEEEYGKICDVILRVGAKEHVSHYERYFIILYIKDVLGVPYSDFSRVFSTIVRNGRDVLHSYGEKQAKYIYSRDSRFNPVTFTLNGYCIPGCQECAERKEWNDFLSTLVVF